MQFGVPCGAPARYHRAMSSRIPTLAILSFPILVFLGYAACTAEDEQDTMCVAGENIFCRCPGGQAGTKACLEGGDSFGPCEPCTGRTTTGTPTGTGTATGTTTGTATGTATGSGGGGTGGAGTAPLYAPCTSESDCESGRCPMGYCTIDCTDVGECEQGVAECVEFVDLTVCMPVCSVQTDCQAYGCSGGVCSQCGYAEAVDLWGVTTCGDWGEYIEFPPEGIDCSYDEQCNLGMAGAQRVCHTFGVCAIGCYQPTDCPSGMDCSSSGAIGTCQ